MSQECVVAVYDSLNRAKNAINLLEKYDFPRSQVSIVRNDVSQEVADKEPLVYGDNSEVDAAKGAGVGGLVGTLLGVPLMAVPGVGMMLIAGPLAVGLTGALVGGLLGAIGGWGVHADHIRGYEEKVKNGAILVVASGTPPEVTEAYNVLQKTEPVELHQHAKTGDDAPEIDDAK